MNQPESEDSTFNEIPFREATVLEDAEKEPTRQVAAIKTSEHVMPSGAKDLLFVFNEEQQMLRCAHSGWRRPLGLRLLLVGLRQPYCHVISESVC